MRKNMMMSLEEEWKNLSTRLTEVGRLKNSNYPLFGISANEIDCLLDNSSKYTFKNLSSNSHYNCTATPILAPPPPPPAINENRSFETTTPTTQLQQTTANVSIPPAAINESKSLEITVPTTQIQHTTTNVLIPLPAINENKSFETTSPTTQLQEAIVNVLIDVNKLSYDCSLSVEDHDHEVEQDDELRRRVEEFIDKINRGWKAEKLLLRCN
ncbi:hypothetical protein L1887_16813 [Cichorium endivia]|nr:hypothetical protein L1887_16813 [Cichorium endivia]